MFFAAADTTTPEVYGNSWASASRPSRISTNPIRPTSRRRSILDALAKLIRSNYLGKDSREDAIHALHAPMRTDSNEIGTEDSNLWIIDERLACVWPPDPGLEGPARLLLSVLADLTTTMVSRCEYAGLRPTYDGMGYFGFNEPHKAHIEVLSFDRR